MCRKILGGKREVRGRLSFERNKGSVEGILSSFP